MLLEVYNNLFNVVIINNYTVIKKMLVEAFIVSC